MVNVQFEEVNKRYDDGFHAVKNLNLDIKDKEFLVLLGPSGCGKSTTLRMLAGLEEVSEGSVLIDGMKVNHLPAGARGLGMVFQSYALYPHMSIRDNLSFGLRMMKGDNKLPEDEISSRVNEIATLLELSEHLAKKPKELSGGQRQRVALGRALVRRPKVLLMDEPLSNLDAELRVQMRLELAILHKELDATMIYVTHDQAEAMALGDRIVVMSKGKIVQTGSPREIYNTPKNSFVADFIGTVNRIPSALINGIGTPKGHDLVFRPEDAEIVEKSSGQFNGKVVNSFFLGDRIRLIVDCGAPEHITIESFQRDVIEEGDEISIRVHQDRFLEIN